MLNRRLDKLLQEKTGINVMIAQDTVSCSIRNRKSTRELRCTRWKSKDK